VLPLLNESGDPELEYLSDGITENVINSLSQLPHLKVIARNTVFRYKGRQVDPLKVGKRLDVRAVLVGRILSLNDRSVISLELRVYQRV
jgi:TolB-like protein